MCRKLNEREFQVQDDINQVNRLLSEEIHKDGYLDCANISALSLAKLAYEMEICNKKNTAHKRKPERRP